MGGSGLSRTVHMPGILLLVYVSGLMFLMRHFAGPLVQSSRPSACCGARVWAPRWDSSR